MKSTLISVCSRLQIIKFSASFHASSHRIFYADMIGTLFEARKSIPHAISLANRISCFDVISVFGLISGSLKYLSSCPRLFLKYPNKSPFCTNVITTNRGSTKKCYILEWSRMKNAERRYLYAN